MNTLVQAINSAGQAFVDFALPMLVQSSVLILVFLLINLILRRRVRATFRYWIWMLILVKFVLPPSLWSPVSIGSWFGDELETPTVSVYEAIDSQSADKVGWVLNPPVSINSGHNAWVENPPYKIEPSEPQEVPQIEYSKAEPQTNVESPETIQSLSAIAPPPANISWQGFVLLGWAVVAIALLLLLGQRALFVKGLIAQAEPVPRSLRNALNDCCARMGLKSEITAKISPNAVSPAVCGLFKPVILVPKNILAKLTPNDLQAVLLHELAHIKRADLWVNFVQTLLQIIYFYNPLLWLANAMIRRVREKAVDEAVLVAMGETAGRYPETLVNVAKLAFIRRPALSLRLIGVVESKSTLTSRIKHILNRPIPKSAKLGLPGLAIVLTIATVFLPMAKARPLTERASNIMSLARQEAQRLNHTYIGTEHILLALARQDESVSAKTLKELNINIDILRIEVGRLLKPGAESLSQQELPYTPAASRVLKRAKEEARALDHDYIGTEHMLLALTREKESIAAQVLENLGLTRQKIRVEILQFVKPGPAKSTEYAITNNNGPLDIRFVGVCPDQSDDILDSNGQKIEILPYPTPAPRGGLWNAQKLCRDFVFELPETKSPVLFVPWRVIHVAGQDTRLDQSNASSLYPVYTGRRQLLFIDTLVPETYQNPVLGLLRQQTSVDRVDVTLRYFHGPSSATIASFNGPFTQNQTLAAKEDPGVTLTVLPEKKNEATKELNARFRLKFSSKMEFDTAILLYDTQGRRHLTWNDSISQSKSETTFDFYVLTESIPLAQVARVAVEKPYEVTAHNVQIVYPDRPARDHAAYLDVMAQRLGLTGMAPQLLSQYQFKTPQEALEVIDIVRGRYHMQQVLQAFGHSKPKICIADLDESMQAKIRRTARLWSNTWVMSSFGIKLGLMGQWPEFFDMAIERLTEGSPINIDSLHYERAALKARLDIANTIVNYVRNLTPEQVETLKETILTLDDPAVKDLLYCLAWTKTQATTDALWELAQDDRPWIWWLALDRLYAQRQGRDQYLSKSLSEPMAVRLALIRGEFHDEDIKQQAITLLKQIFTTELARMNSSTWWTASERIARYADKTTATSVYIDYLRQVQWVITTPQWKIDEIFKNGCGSKVAAIIRRLNLWYSRDFGGLGTDETPSSSTKAYTIMDTGKLGPLITEVLAWYDREGTPQPVVIAFEGRVVDTAGKPISGVQLSLTEYQDFTTPEGHQAQRHVDVEQCYSDTEGYFTFGDLGKNRFLELNVTADGYMPRKSLHIQCRVDGRYQLYAPDANNVIELQRPTRVSGIVLGTDGKPLAEVLIRGLNDPDYGSPSEGKGTITDDQGRFTAENVAQGYKLVSYTEMHQVRSSNGIQNKYIGPCAATRVNVIHDHDVNDVVLDLSKSTCSLEMKLTDTNGDPVESAIFDFGAKMPNKRRPRKALFSSYETDPAGIYRFNALPPGQWLLTIQTMKVGFRVIDVTLEPDQTAHYEIQIDTNPYGPRSANRNPAKSERKSYRIDLPDLETPDANVVFDLASGQMLSAKPMQRDRNHFTQLGKGDIAYEYAQNKSALLCLRGARMQRRTKEDVKPLSPDVTREGFVGYFLPGTGGRIQITTAEDHKYDITILSVEKKGCTITYTGPPDDEDVGGGVLVGLPNVISALSPLGSHALAFDGIDDCLIVPPSPSLMLKPPFTIEMWIKPDFSDVQTLEHPAMILVRQGEQVLDPPNPNSVQKRGFVTFIHPPTESNPKRYGSFFWGNEWGGLAQSGVFDHFDPIENDYPGWKYVCISQNEAANKFFLPSSDEPLVIGQNFSHKTGSFKGHIAEIRLWNKRLSEDEIHQYGKMSLTGNEPNLIACWDFEQQPDSQIVYDISLNANHAHLGAFDYADKADPRWVDLVSEQTVSKGGITGQVVDPNGDPVVGAQVAVCTEKKQLTIVDGALDTTAHQRRGVALVQTDEMGWFSFAPEPNAVGIAVVHKQGVAWATCETLAAGPVVPLQPWGQVGGRLYIGRELGTDERLGLWTNHDRDILDGHLSCRNDAYSNADGRFIIKNVLPGWVEVGYMIQTGGMPSPSWTYTSRTPVRVMSGQTSLVTIGGRGRPVVGKFVTPEGYDGPLYFGAGLRALDTARPEIPKPDDFDEMTQREQQQWINQWVKTDEAKAFYDAMWHDPQRRFYSFYIQDDGSYRIEDVIPGRYTMTVWLEEGAPQHEEIGGYSGIIEVPEMDEDYSDDPMDVDELVLYMHPPLHVGDTAPLFEAKTLKGRDIRLADYRGHFVLLSFWKPVFHPELERLKAMYADYMETGQLQIIGLGGPDTLPEVKRYVDEQDIEWPQIYTGDTADNDIIKEYRPSGWPYILLIDPKGKIVATCLREDKLIDTVHRLVGEPKRITDTSTEKHSNDPTVDVPDCMKQLGLAVALYLNEHDGQLPDTIGPLEAYFSKPEAFAWVQENVTYTGKGHLKDYSKTYAVVTGYETTPDPTGQRYVTFLDGHIEHIEADRFEALRKATTSPTPKPPARRTDDTLAWQRTDRYVAPDPEGFFPDDTERGKRLDALFKAVDRDRRSDEEILSTVRQGFRTTQQYRTLVLAWIGNRYIWNKDPQNAEAIEIMYHAVPMQPHYAVYFGLSVVKDKTPNILRTLADLCIQSQEVGRITWGLGSQRNQIIPYIEPYLNDSDPQKRETASVLIRHFKGELDFDQWKESKRLEEAKAQFNDKLPDFKETLLNGNSQARRETLNTIMQNQLTPLLDDSFLSAMAAAATDPDRKVRNDVARTAGGRWIWHAQEQNTNAIALMLKLTSDTDREVRYNAVYYGLSVVLDKSEAVVRRLIEMALVDHENNLYGRIVWGLKGTERNNLERFTTLLSEHVERAKSNRTLAASIDTLYRDVLETDPPKNWELGDVSKDYPRDLFTISFSPSESFDPKDTDLVWAEFIKTVPENIVVDRAPSFRNRDSKVCIARVRGQAQVDAVKKAIEANPKLLFGQVTALPVSRQLYLQEQFGMTPIRVPSKPAVQSPKKGAGPIQQRIDAASPGETITLEPGIYEEQLVINKPLTLQGAGWDKTTLLTRIDATGLVEEMQDTIRKQMASATSDSQRQEIAAKVRQEYKEKANRPVLLVTQTQGVVIRGIRFSHPGKHVGSMFAVVKVHDSGVRMSDCAIVGAVADGIHIVDGSNVEIDNTLVAAAWSTGVMIGENSSPPSRVHIHDSDIRNNHYAEIRICPGNDQVRIERCRISGAAWHGIRYDDASPTLENNLIFGNARSGIYASGKTTAIIRDNLFYANESGGMSCWFQNTDRIENNTFVDNNQLALSIIGASKPVLRKNIFCSHPMAIVIGDVQDNSPFAKSDGTVDLQNNLLWANENEIQRYEGQTPHTITLDDETQTLRVDPEFVSPEDKNFALKVDSPAREPGMGALNLIPFESPWPLQPEESAIIPNGPTRDYRQWKGKD